VVPLLATCDDDDDDVAPDAEWVRVSLIATTAGELLEEAPLP